jgi:ABC-type glycerol-3-phosphate transport system substrate-binding protein
MSTFQLIVVSVFVGFIIVGVGVFAIFGGAFGGAGIGAVTVWGTQPQEEVDYLLDSMRSVDSSLQEVRYAEQKPETYEQVLLNAMASGTGPDLMLVTQEQLGAFSDKVVPIPFGTLSQSQFLGSYIDEGQLFLTPQGSLALPFAVDPLVMYWNRDLFAGAGIAQPPQYWSEFTAANGLPTKINAYSSAQITRSAVALGVWDNVTNAKAVLSTLFMQAGEFVTGRNAQGALLATFGQSGNAGSAPAESALRFYTEFANPSKTTYSWNRSLPRSADAFAGGTLAVYFGFASEYGSIAEQNPNLRFAVSLMPQLQGSGVPLTYGRLTGLAIPRSARNIPGAAVVAQKLTSATAAGVMATRTGRPSARRDVPLDTASSAAADVFSRSALISRGWVDPSNKATDAVFKTMIESVVSGRSEPATAVSDGAQEFTRLLPQSY